LAAFLLAAGVGSSGPTRGEPTVVSCTFGGATDSLSRGFYVTHFPADNIAKITLGYVGASGSYEITLTARRGTFDGPLIGKHPLTVYLNGRAETQASFDFTGTRVAPGSTIAFTQHSRPGGLHYDAGTGSIGASGPCANVVETQGTSPPLDTPRRHSVGLLITAQIRPGTKIVQEVINRRRHTAFFRFRATGAHATHFGCTLIRPRGRALHSSCGSPMKYLNLLPGPYRFEVRAANTAGHDPTPAVRGFTI
jgi:hypothetical protein